MTHPLKIMIVDDDATTLAVVSAILERQGHEVTARETALGTTRAIIRERPDVVLLDVRMPGLSGDRLAQLIAAESERPPRVILLSSSSKAELEELVRSSGAMGFIEKTGDPSEFLRRFDALVAAPRGAQRGAPRSGHRT
jgi:DNA-binding response OmpR family regulator